MRWARGLPPALGVIVLLTAGAAGSDSITDFLGRHWPRPLPPQGPPPARFTTVEASLHPEACGTCHPAQLADWQTSLHAKAMGPGVAGQLVEMLDRDPAAALGCQTCHAPLAEQAPLAAVAAGFAKNPVLDPALRDKGVACAGCHVRGHERFGPPRRDGSLASATPRERLPHRGATRSEAFLRSEFCQGCHQFAPDGFALNGKLLEDTYAEWRQSPFAARGVHCQDCHMADRRHRWRGIHDAETVRAGLTITAETGAPRDRPGETVSATLRVTSTGVGHAFPTYVTPRVILTIEQLDGRGQAIAGTGEARVIGREVALDLSRELSDTRLKPGETAVLAYHRRVERLAASVRFSVIVEPDAFYTRFYETLLREGAGRGAAQIREALAASRRSPFSVFERVTPLR